jgi:hypothetical protein
MKTRIVVVLLASLALVSCARQIPQPAETPPLVSPDSLGRDLFQRGQLKLDSYGQSVRTEAIVEVSDESMSVVILGPTPRPWLQVTYERGELNVVESGTIRPYPLPADRLLGDLQLALWPDLSGVDLGRFRVEKHENGDRSRKVFGPGGLFLEIKYRSWPPWSGGLTIHGPDRRYELTFEPMEREGPSR